MQVGFWTNVETSSQSSGILTKVLSICSFCGMPLFLKSIIRPVDTCVIIPGLNLPYSRQWVLFAYQDASDGFQILNKLLRIISFALNIVWTVVCCKGKNQFFIGAWLFGCIYVGHSDGNTTRVSKMTDPVDGVVSSLHFGLCFKCVNIEMRFSICSSNYCVPDRMKYLAIGS